MRTFRNLVCFCCSLVLSNLMCLGQPNNRVALVIGNSSYINYSALKNPIEDANLIDSTLRVLDFEVINIRNASKKEMDIGFTEFMVKAESADIRFIYYSGHGNQLDGQNYLIPIDAHLKSARSYAINCISFSNWLSELRFDSDASTIISLDACRNNPFENKYKGQNGLTQDIIPSGILLSYATQPGQLAIDDGSYSRFLSRALLDTMRIDDVFRTVRRNVTEKTKGRQEPLAIDELNYSFYLNGLPSDKTITLPRKLEGESLISIESNPDSARIFIDAMEINRKTPFSSAISKGYHRFKLIMPGYAIIDTSIFLTNDEYNLSFKLSSTWSELVIYGQAGDKLTLTPITDGKPKTLERKRETDGSWSFIGSSGGLNPGKYSLNIYRDRYLPLDTTLILNRANRVILTPQLKPKLGYLTITSSPANALIEINGKRLDRNTPLTTAQLIGKYKIAVSSKGYFSQTRNVQIKEGRLVKIDLKLEDYPQKLRAYRTGQWLSLSLALISYGSAVYFNSMANSNYENYLVATSEAESLRNEVERQDQLTKYSMALGSAAFGVGVYYAIRLENLKQKTGLK